MATFSGNPYGQRTPGVKCFAWLLVALGAWVAHIVAPWLAAFSAGNGGSTQTQAGLLTVGAVAVVACALSALVSAGFGLRAVFAS